MEHRLPPPVDVADEVIRDRLERWRTLRQRHEGEGLADLAAAAEARTPLVAAARASLAYSPFLAEALFGEPRLLGRVEAEGTEAVVEALMAAQAGASLDDRVRLMRQLRRTRVSLSLVLGLADLAGLLDLETVTGALSRFADLATAQALDHVLLEASKRGDLVLDDRTRPAEGTGLFIVGMGKHGAGELNYSSDIDLIVLFDGDKLAERAKGPPMALAARLTKALVHVLEHKTRDGFVFRTDLRLRPHPPGHPLALSTEDAEIYYERFGQNWERAAFIKARIVAGDRASGERFLRNMAPFVWRRHLDFAAIRDIHSIKRQINAYRGFGRIGVKGHDLKVGRGGIREIEFFVQTQQLILGGRNPELRDPRTLAALDRLAQGHWIEETTAEELKSAYVLLRQLEHRLQMVADRQTQLIPGRDQDFERFTRFAGFAASSTFAESLEATLRRVEHHYAQLFESEPDLGAGGQLVFTGTEDDPGTLETLRRMGFRNPEAVSARIRAWHHGHIRATRSTRARELLTELVPAILDVLQRQSDIDEAFALFDSFVSSLPAGVQLFSLIRANPRLLLLLSDLMGAAPRLAEHLSRNVDLFDAMLAPDFFEPLPDEAVLEAEFQRLQVDARSLEDRLDICRRWAHGRQFQAGLHVLLGLAEASQACRTHTTLAEVVLRALLPVAEGWLETQHGRIEGGRFVVLGLGKLGSRELTTGSDLDLVFVYDAPAEAKSDGDRPLDGTTYYARLGQRLVSAISARTAEGSLYEIDTRLRPSGNVGPVATSLDNFARYQKETAQSWELQAMTRARLIAGDSGLGAEVGEALEAAIRQPRDAATLSAEVRAMRERIAREHGSDDPWRLKYARGGLVELEFAAQFLQLAHAFDHPGIRATETVKVFENAAELGLIENDRGRALVSAHGLFHALQAVLRLSTASRFRPKEAPVGLREALVRAANRQLGTSVPIGHFDAIEAQLIESQESVRQFFDELCPPAADD